MPRARRCGVGEVEVGEFMWQGGWLSATRRSVHRLRPAGRCALFGSHACRSRAAAIRPWVGGLSWHGANWVCEYPLGVVSSLCFWLQQPCASYCGKRTSAV